MAFKIPSKDKQLPTDIINLFHRLGKLDRLSLQQGESIKEYEGLRDTKSDFAIEMPAGHGKTLVGGLIAEYNRLTRNWRVVYTCATRQLASQTHALLKSYGIESVLLVGKSENFSTSDYGRYSRSSAVCVTTYSHIFNINSRFDDAHQIIFDDAHATEYAINNFWSLNIQKKKFSEIFMALFATLGDAVAKHVQDKINYGTFDPLTDGVDIIPQSLWISKKDDIRALLDNKADGTDLYFPWSRIRSHLHCCQIYITHSTIVIRPVLPPNLRHVPFVNAKERIYMTATTGNAGELERIFGVPSIHKISKFPPGSNKVSGRRLILFPEDHFDKDEIWNVLASTIRMQPRCLILCPSENILENVRGNLANLVPEYTIFLAKDIEDSMHDFIASTNGILLLAGRYEGIDLKDEDCRLQIIFELPVAVGIPEQFLQMRLRSVEVLKNLLATRIIQGLGRCTRGTKDYAAVLFLGRRVGEFLYKDEFRKLLPAEVDAEIAFGFDQIDHINDLENWKESLSTFLKQGEEWEAVEEHIKDTTDVKNKDRINTNELNEALLNATQKELSYIYSLWDNDLEQAHLEADGVLHHLARKEELRGYRAWWNYLIACIGKLQGNENKLKEYHKKAVQASSNKLWLDKRVFDESLNDEEHLFPETVEIQMQHIFTKLESYGDRDKLFESDWKKVLTGLISSDANLFEPALRELGVFLGLDADRPLGKGTPDGIWNHDNCWIAFEAKTNIKDESSSIPLDDIRQTGYHSEWVQKRYGVTNDEYITVVMICPKQHVEEYASHATEGIYLIDPEEITGIASKLEIILRATIQKLKYSTHDDARLTLGTELMEHNLWLSPLLAFFRRKKLGDAIK